MRWQFALIVLSGFFCQSLRAAEPADAPQKTLIFAAASTTDAVEEVRQQFERAHPGITARASYAASSTLAQQIAAGAEADVFLSASVEWAEFLEKKKLVAESRDLLGNQLVIVVPSDAEFKPTELKDLLSAKVHRVALADPQSVPAGIYAKQALTKLKLWEQMESKVVGAADVRQALTFVETGAAEAGIVYATDAAASKKVAVTGAVDAKLSGPIVYRLVLLKSGAEKPAARALYEALQSPAAGEQFRKRGFRVLKEEAKGEKKTGGK